MNNAIKTGILIISTLVFIVDIIYSGFIMFTYRPMSWDMMNVLVGVLLVSLMMIMWSALNETSSGYHTQPQ